MDYKEIWVSQNYYKNDIVFDNGLYYICIQNTTTSQPVTDINYWEIFSYNIPGPTGATGDPGAMRATGAMGSQGVISYGSGGLISNVKIWAGDGNTSSGLVTFDISSANYSQIIAINATVENNTTAANQCWAVITTSSTSSIIVAVYRSSFSSVTVLGIPVIGNAQQELYTGSSVNVNIIVIGI